MVRSSTRLNLFSGICMRVITFASMMFLLSVISVEASKMEELEDQGPKSTRTDLYWPFNFFEGAKFLDQLHNQAVIDEEKDKKRAATPVKDLKDFLHHFKAPPILVIEGQRFRVNSGLYFDIMTTAHKTVETMVKSASFPYLSFYQEETGRAKLYYYGGGFGGVIYTAFELHMSKLK